MVTVITELGDVIPLTGDLVNGGPAADAFVAAERQRLGLPAAPLHAEKDAAQIETLKNAREAAPAPVGDASVGDLSVKVSSPATVKAPTGGTK